jgi:hypothetical protein
MKRLIVVVFVSLMFLTGCRSLVYYGGIKPLYPNAGHAGYNGSNVWPAPVIVDSLTPTFRWQPDTDRPCTYDFAIWDEGEKIGNPLIGYSSGMDLLRLGHPIYYKEALTQPEHKIELPLGPSTLYYWSVRIRAKDTVSDWAYFDFIDYGLLAGGQLTRRQWFYDFETPKADKK